MGCRLRNPAGGLRVALFNVGAARTAARAEHEKLRRRGAIGRQCSSFRGPLAFFDGFFDVFGAFCRFLFQHAVDEVAFAALFVLHFH